VVRRGDQYISTEKTVRGTGSDWEFSLSRNEKLSLRTRRGEKKIFRWAAVLISINVALIIGIKNPHNMKARK